MAARKGRRARAPSVGVRSGRSRTAGSSSPVARSSRPALAVRSHSYRSAAAQCDDVDVLSSRRWPLERSRVTTTSSLVAAPFDVFGPFRSRHGPDPAKIADSRARVERGPRRARRATAADCASAAAVADVMNAAATGRPKPRARRPRKAELPIEGKRRGGGRGARRVACGGQCTCRRRAVAAADDVAPATDGAAPPRPTPPTPQVHRRRRGGTTRSRGGGPKWRRQARLRGTRAAGADDGAVVADAPRRARAPSGARGGGGGGGSGGRAAADAAGGARRRADRCTRSASTRRSGRRGATCPTTARAGARSQASLALARSPPRAARCRRSARLNERASVPRGARKSGRREAQARGGGAQVGSSRRRRRSRLTLENHLAFVSLLADGTAVLGRGDACGGNMSSYAISPDKNRKNTENYNGLSLLELHADTIGPRRRQRSRQLGVGSTWRTSGRGEARRGW